MAQPFDQDRGPNPEVDFFKFLETEFESGLSEDESTSIYNSLLQQIGVYFYSGKLTSEELAFLIKKLETAEQQNEDPTNIQQLMNRYVEEKGSVLQGGVRSQVEYIHPSQVNSQPESRPAHWYEFDEYGPVYGKKPFWINVGCLAVAAGGGSIILADLVGEKITKITDIQVTSAGLAGYVIAVFSLGFRELYNRRNNIH